MIKPCTFSRLILALSLFVIPNFLLANGDPTGGPGNGGPSSQDSIASKLGHCNPIIIPVVNCATHTVELGAFVSYAFTGITDPYVTEWSTGETAHKITITPPGVWSFDPTSTGCELVHWRNEYVQPGSFFTGAIDITSQGPICPGGSVLLDVDTANYSFNSFLWTPDSLTEVLTPFEVYEPGTYTLQVLDDLGCPFTDQVTVQQSPPINSTVSGPPYMCPEGDTSTVQVNEIWNSYQWSNGETTQSIKIYEPGLYEATVTNQYGCTGISTYGVQSGEIAGVPINASSTSICVGEPDTLSVIGNFSQYQWSNNVDSKVNIVTMPGTYMVTVTNAYGCTGVDSITITQCIPAPWTVIPTSRNHTIIIPDTLKFDALGGALQIGDQIGVFYDSAGTGVLKCGGFAAWSGLNLVFPVYGNDAAPLPQNGFNSGEIFKIKFWRSNTNRTFDATAQYAPIGSIGGLISQTNSFADDGVSMIISITEGIIHAIPLKSGWNMISSYLLPTHPNMLDVFEPIANSVDIIKDGDGVSCIPIIPINIIGNWNLQKGYQVRANQNDTLIVLGHRLLPEANPIPLHTGWQLISYLRETPQNTDTVFKFIKPQISLVKNNEGKIYSPQFGINQIGNMLPGQGYKVKALSNVSLMYRPNLTGPPVAQRNEPTSATEFSHFVLDSTFNTGNNSTLILTDLVAQTVLGIGDEIGVFTPAGVLCGTGVYEAQNLAITVWGDDSSTPDSIEGMQNSEAYKIKVWDILKQKECSVVTAFVSGKDAYVPDGIEVFETLTFGEPTFASITAEACDSFVLNNQTYNSSGTYTQVLTNAAGCDSTLTIHLTINPAPNVTVNAPTICPGQTANLTADGATNYLWSTGETTNSITVNPNTTTTYTVEGTSAGCSTSVVTSVAVADLPNIDLGANIVLTAGDSALLDATCICQSYIWSTGETTATIQVYSLGTYTVTVSNQTGCTTSDEVVILTTSTNDPIDGYSLSVSPNPTKDLVRITCQGASTTAVQVVDQLGKVVLAENRFVPDGVSRTLSLKTIPPGAYYVRIVGDGFTRSVSVIKH